MSEKRKDSKGRVLRTGETQRPDGMYEYKYKDLSGKRRSVYSWLLVSTDKPPKGKRSTAALRDLEDQIRKNLDKGIKVFEAKSCKLNEYFQYFIDSKVGLKRSTRASYIQYYNRCVRDNIGNLTLDKITPQHIRELYTRLINERNYAKKTLKYLDVILRYTLELAYQESLISRNPATNVFDSVTSGIGLVERERTALTAEDQALFMNFVKNHPRHCYWYNLFTFLLGTGCRIGECTGLRWEDVDLKNGVISINHNITKMSIDGRLQAFASTPKTKTGNREIPMLPEVREALINQRKLQLVRGGCKISVDGYTNFVFMTKHNGLITKDGVRRRIHSAVDDYNAQETELAEKEGRAPHYLEHFACHIFRHTFATRFIEAGGDMKVLQTILGHTSVATTMDVYSHVNPDIIRDGMMDAGSKINFG